LGCFIFLSLSSYEYEARLALDKNAALVLDVPGRVEHSEPALPFTAFLSSKSDYFLSAILLFRLRIPLQISGSEGPSSRRHPRHVGSTPHQPVNKRAQPEFLVGWIKHGRQWVITNPATLT